MNHFPWWLKKRYLPIDDIGIKTSIFKGLSINTVCRFAKCPNSNDCFSRNAVTFMILGSRCTRSCSFCSVDKGATLSLDSEELRRIVKAVRLLNLKYLVVTSPARDDLGDGGAGRFETLIKMLKKDFAYLIIEVLIPDFGGDFNATKKVVLSEPQVLGHNIETVPRLYPLIRPEASYEKSLNVLKIAKNLNADIITKSSLLLGFGEEDSEIQETLEDLRSRECDILVLGQYLRPGDKNIPVKNFIHPDKFEYYKRLSLDMGFKSVLSKPFARSSFQAEELYEEAKMRRQSVKVSTCHSIKEKAIY